MNNDLYFLINDFNESYNFDFLSKKSSDKEITDHILSLFYQVNEPLKNDDYFMLEIKQDNLFLHDKSLSNTTLIGEICPDNLDKLFDGSFNSYFQSFYGKISVFDNMKDLKEYLIEDLALNITDSFKSDHPNLELDNNLTVPDKYSKEIDELISLHLKNDDVLSLISKVNNALIKEHLPLIDKESFHNFFYPDNYKIANKKSFQRI